jgi:hypothetical protein
MQRTTGTAPPGNVAPQSETTPNVLTSPQLAVIEGLAAQAQWQQRPERVQASPSEKDSKLAQKLGQLQPFLVVSPQECTGQLPSSGPT